MSEPVVVEHRHRWLRWLLLALLILLICGGALAVIAAKSVKTVPATGGTVAIDMSSPSGFINPLLAATDTDQAITTVLFQGLLKFSPSGTLAPDLASAWKVSDHGRTFTFQLRHGLTWQNGAPLTSADVAYTYRLLASPSFPTYDEEWRSLSVSTPNPSTVVIHLPRSNYTFPNDATVGIVPRNYDGSRTPVGVGPYVFGRASPQAIYLTPDPELTTGSFLSSLVFRLHGSAAPARPTLDCYQSWSTQTSRLTVATTRELALFFDLRTTPQVAVRKALLAALEQSHAPALVGFSNPMPAWPSSGTSTVRRLGVPPPKLLRSRGWKHRAGTWTKGKEDIRLTLVVGNNPAEEAIAAAVAKAWRAVGFQVTLRHLAFPVMIRKVLYPGAFNAAIVEWNFGSSDYDPSALWARDQPLDFAHVTDPVVTKLSQQVSATPSRARRNSLRKMIGDRLMSQGIALGLASDRYVCSLPAKLHGFQAPTLVTDAGGLLYSLPNWYLRTKLVLRNPLPKHLSFPHIG